MDILDDSIEKVSLEHDNISIKELALRSSRVSSRSINSLSQAAAIEIARQLLECEQPMNCPDGKPTIYELTHNELSKKIRLVLNAL